MRLSILDQSPVIDGLGARRAIAETIALARRADELGYHRYWLAEHHALAALAEARSAVEKTDIRMYEPEIHRLRGEFLLAANPQNVADAEACFHQAIEVARRDRAKALQLRATTRLAWLWQRQGRGNEARAALAAVYDTYAEGLLTPDLVEAAAQLKA